MGRINEPIIFLAKEMWKYSKGNRHIVVVFVSFFIIANLLVLLQPLILAKILNIIQLEGVSDDNLKKILLWCLGFIIIDLSFWLFHGVARVLENNNAFKIKYNYKQNLFDGIMNLPAKWHNESQSGDVIDKVETASNGIFVFSKRSYIVISNTIRLVASAIFIMFLSPSASISVLIVILLSIYLIMKFDSVLRVNYKRLYQYDNEIAAKTYDSISNITTIIILRIEKLISNDIFRTMLKPFGIFKKNNVLNEVKWFTISILASLLTASVIASYVYFTYSAGEAILIGTVSALFIYVGRITGVFFEFAATYEEILRQKVAVENAEVITDLFEDKKKNKSKKLNPKWQKIEIRKLNFKYDDKEGSHLKDISFNIRRKEKIAIIGESGAGKTTLLKILRGLYEPHTININIDSKNEKNGNHMISERTMLIPQEPEIFVATIRNNITMGINHNLNYIKKFTNIATFTKVVNELPNKWDSNINEKGVNLSGGEKQRLALARALIGADSKDFLLMDESTSSVDTKNELQIYTSVFREFKNKTILATIHKYNLLHLFDRIIMLEKGKIVCDGTFDELLKTSPKFRKQWNKYINKK